MILHIRRAGAHDTRAMADLLNEIIAKGGTTSMTRPVTAADLSTWMEQTRGRNAWHVAEDDLGQTLGSQFIEPKNKLPPDACDIATFARLGHSGLGIGSRLFDVTRLAAAELGYRWINATIRPDRPSCLPESWH